MDDPIKVVCWVVLRRAPQGMPLPGVSVGASPGVAALLALPACACTHCVVRVRVHVRVRVWGVCVYAPLAAVRPTPPAGICPAIMHVFSAVCA